MNGKVGNLMHIEMSEVKNICRNRNYILSELKKDEESQKNEFVKLRAIMEHFRFYRFHYQCRFYNDCIQWIPSHGGAKEDFVRSLDCADRILLEAENFMTKDFDVCIKPVRIHFVAGRDGDLYGIWDEQFSFKKEYENVCYLSQAFRFLKQFRKEVDLIRYCVLEGKRKKKDEDFYENHGFQKQGDVPDYEKLCKSLKELCMEHYDELLAGINS